MKQCCILHVNSKVLQLLKESQQIIVDEYAFKYKDNGYNK